MSRLFSQIIMVILVILLAGMITGCFDSIEEIPLNGEVEEIEAPEIIQVNTEDGAVTLAWNTVDKAEGYRVYRRTVQGDERMVAGTADTSYTDRNLLNGRDYYYSVAGVGSSELEGSRSEWVQAVPSAYSIVINQGSGYTNSRNAVLTLTAPVTTSLMKISNDAGLDGADWETFRTTRSWILKSGDGLKTVYAVFMDENGSESGVVTKTVNLDTYASVSGITIAPESGNNIGDIIHFRMDVEGNETEGEGHINIEGYSRDIELYDNGVSGDNEASDGIYEVDFRSPSSLRGVDLMVTGIFTDRAGNISPLFEAEGTLSFTDPPEPVNLLGAIDSTVNRITINWVPSVDQNFHMYRIYRDTVSHSEAEFEDPRYRIRELFNPEQDSYPDSGLEEAQVYYYRIFVVNDMDETAASNQISAHTYDAMPDPVTLDPLSSIGADRVTLTWSVNQNSDFMEYRIYRDTSPGVTNQPSLLVATIEDREITWYDDTGIDLTINDLYYRIYIYDKSGNFSRSNEVTSAE
ncbi:MAG: fibronectin type III domain-containing protein [Candidatus Krumholzibacteriales bacterium]